MATGDDDDDDDDDAQGLYEVRESHVSFGAPPQAALLPLSPPGGAPAQLPTPPAPHRGRELPPHEPELSDSFLARTGPNEPELSDSFLARKAPNEPELSGSFLARKPPAGDHPN